MYWHHFQCYKYGIGSGDEGAEEVMEKEELVEEPSVERSVAEEASSVVRVKMAGLNNIIVYVIIFHG